MRAACPSRPRVRKRSRTQASRAARATARFTLALTQTRGAGRAGPRREQKRGFRANTTNGDHLRSLARSHRARVAARRVASDATRDARR